MVLQPAGPKLCLLGAPRRRASGYLGLGVTGVRGTPCGLVLPVGLASCS